MIINRTDIKRFRIASIVICLVSVIVIIFGFKEIGFPLLALGLFFLFTPYKVGDNTGKSSSPESFSFKKEIYINQLVKAFRKTYNCGDMAAIECLRKNYSSTLLKQIIKNLAESEQAGILDDILHTNSPFEESQEEVVEMDIKFGGE